MQNQVPLLGSRFTAIFIWRLRNSRADAFTEVITPL